MAYTPQKTSGYSKPAQKQTEATPAPKADAATATPAVNGEKRMPVGNLYVQGPEEEKKTKLTGLFKEVSKAGQVYYRGKSDNGDKFIVFLD